MDAAVMSRISRPRVRAGLIGFGFIGSQVYRRLTAEPEHGIDVAFVHNRHRARIQSVPAGLVLDDLGAMSERAPDLVVEMAHPDFTRTWGETILGLADYLPLSVTALADDGLMERLQMRAATCGTRLLIPHGALMGTDNLIESRAAWQEVEITFIKNPVNIDFSDSGFDPARVVEETVIYDGPVRAIAAIFPRNVNTMVTCALATIGLDRCRARLIGRPGIDFAIVAVRARGHDGSVLEMRKQQPMAGVSGTEMFESQFHSILRAARTGATLGFV